MIAGCAVGPDFHRPDADVPADWRPAQTAADAPVISRPADAPLNTAWWTSFNDPELIKLEDRVAAANLDLKVASIRLAESRAMQCSDEPEIFSRSPVHPVDGPALQAATKTIYTAAVVSHSLKCVGSAIEEIVQTAAGSSDLTLVHWLILVHLSRAHRCKQGDLHSETGIATGYLTRLLDDLYAKEMIRRRRSTVDRRQILLSLTDHGKDAALSLLASIDQHRLLNALDQLKSSLDSFMSISAPGDPQ